MKIAIANLVEINCKIGGTERISSNLAIEFERLGHTVFFVAQRKYKYSEPNYKPVVEQMMLPNPLIADCEENIIFLSSFLVEKKIDILKNQCGRSVDFSNLCIAVKKRTNIKLLTVYHFDPAYEIKNYNTPLSLLRFRSWIMRQIYFYLKKTIQYKRLKKECSDVYYRNYMASDAVILLSNHFRPSFKTIAGLNDISKLKSIPNFPAFRVSEENIPKEKQILWIGRICNSNKRPERLVQIWSYLEDKHPDWHVLFLGDGPSKQSVEHFVKRMGLKNVRFGGLIDPEEEYRKSSIICITSTHEGLPMVLLEGMQFGVVPLAFSSFESIEDIIEEGITGYKIQPFDLKQYAHRLESLMTDENKRRQMALNAQKHVAEKFDVQKICKKWITLFEDVLSDKI